MRTKRWHLALGVGLLLALATACNFSATTANISSLKIGKDKDVSSEASNFAPTDTVYAVAAIANVPDKVKVKARLLSDAGPIPGAETTLDMPGSGTAKFNFSPSPEGWPKGKYKVEIQMLNDDGQQKDQKTAEFTVS